jgi:uncharacterized repeat protein (TIGR03803 family)
MQASDGYLYGTTATGGARNGGTVYKMDLSGRLITVHSFDSTGSGPGAPVVQGADGALYGTTGVFSEEAASAYGVTSTGTFSLLQQFPPFTTVTSPLTPAFGILYGDTQNGGSLGTGTAFRLDPQGGAKTLHEFAGDEGSYPGGLLLGSDNSFYAVNRFGGAGGTGTVFRMTPAGVVSPIHELSMDEGALCDQPLIEASDGNLYGTCNLGGNALGTVFRVTTDGTLTVIHSFVDAEGGYPVGPLLQANDGKLYGLTGDAPGPIYGTIYRLDLDGSNFGTVHVFDPGTEGGTPQGGGLVQASDGNIYGTLSLGFGSVFRLVMASFAVTRMTPTSGEADGGLALSIGGVGFTPGASVSLGGVPASDIQVLDPVTIEATSPALPPGTLADLTVGPSPSSTLSGAFFADFLDVPQAHVFHQVIETLVRHGITAGCGGGSFCPDGSVTRSRTAVLLLRTSHGAAYTPPPCVGLFSDVPCPGPFTDWVEALFLEGITGGCGGGRFCPDYALSRQQLAPLLLKTEHGSAYVPPQCVGRFQDVPCPGPFADWIEALANEEVTSGCLTSPPLFCPLGLVTRAQAAAFLVSAFKLP